MSQTAPSSNTEPRRNLVVAVTNADGLPGFYAARGLLTARGQWQKVIACVSDSETEFARQLRRDGADVREYDLGQPNTIAAALKDAHALVFAQRLDFDMTETCRAVIDVLTDRLRAPVTEEPDQTGAGPTTHHQGIRALVMLSCISAQLGEAAANGSKPTDHHDTPRLWNECEKLVLKHCKQGTSIARSGVPMQSLFYISDVIQSKGVIPLNTGNGEWAPVNAKDASAAISELVYCLATGKPNPVFAPREARAESAGSASASSSSQPQRYTAPHGKVYLLTGAQLVNGKTVAETATRVFGSNSNIQFKAVDDGEMRRILEAGGELGRFEVEDFVRVGALVRAGKLAVRTPELEKLIRRQPMSIDKFFKENAAAFKPSGRIATSAIRDY